MFQEPEFVVSSASSLAVYRAELPGRAPGGPTGHLVTVLVSVATVVVLPLDGLVGMVGRAPGVLVTPGGVVLLRAPSGLPFSWELCPPPGILGVASVVVLLRWVPRCSGLGCVGGVVSLFVSGRVFWGPRSSTFGASRRSLDPWGVGSLFFGFFTSIGPAFKTT